MSRRAVKPLPPVNQQDSHRLTVAPELVPHPWQTPAAAASGQPLTLAELQQLAVAHNPAMGRAHAEVEAARGRWVQVGLRKNPTIGYEGTDIGEGGSAGKHGGFVSQEFVTANKRHIAREVVQREIYQRQQELEVIRRRVLGDVQARYLETAFAQRQLELLSELVKLAENEVQLTERLRKAQEISTLDVLAAQRIRDRVNLRRQRGEYQLATAWRKLAAVVGATGLTQTTLANPSLASTAPPDWDTVWEQLRSESPQMAAAVAARQRAQWQLQLAQARRRPNYEVTAGVQNDTLVQETLANVAVGVPLPLFNRNQGAICEAEAGVAAAENDIHRVRMNLQHRLAVTYGAWLDAHQRAEYYDQHILPNLQQSLELVERAFQQKQLDYLTVVRTQRELIQTRLDQLEAEEQVHAALAALDNLLLSGSLDPS
ncbi:MAG: TolC family protein [Planctomycetota bacterium]|nr:TolC family protein [Planctomycetota bacterium]